MNIYYYVHTGHRFGLDRFRKASAIIRALDAKNIKITLLTSDFRIASVAKEYGIKKAIGIDVIRNIPNIAPMGSILLYDSPEHNDIQYEEMLQYFSKIIRISEKENETPYKGEFLINPYLAPSSNVCNGVIVDDIYFNAHNKNNKTTLFWGDDDYDERLMKIANQFKVDQFLLGFYHFFNYEQRLSSFFKEIKENEDYNDIVMQSSYLLTASPQTALEALASKSNPIFINRADYLDDHLALIKQYNIPIYNEDEIKNIKNETIEYKIINNDMEKIINFILKIIE
jgi:hypothetical protein